MLADGREPPVAHSIVYDLPAESGFSAPMIDTHTGRTVVLQAPTPHRKRKKKEPNHYRTTHRTRPGLPDTTPCDFEEAFGFTSIAASVNV